MPWGLGVTAMKRVPPAASAVGMPHMLFRLHILHDRVPYDKAELGAYGAADQIDR